MEINSNDYVIFPSTKKMISASFISLLFTVGGAVFILLTFISEGDIFTILLVRFIGIISFLFFGLCLTYFSGRLISKKPALIITDEGIYENSSYIGAGKIKWHEVKDAYIYEYMGEKMLGIETYDPDLVISRKSGFKKFLVKTNKKLINSQISIPQNGVSITLEEIHKIIVEKMGKN